MYTKFPKETVFQERNSDRRISYYSDTDGGICSEEYRTSILSRFSFVFNIKRILLEIFLPQGYPTSVSPDYLTYQIWDTVQAFCSTISGTLTTHAIFKGVGVGDQTANALSAAVTWILKDGTGMIGRILFAWWKGTNLDTDCKKWRLTADVINDLALGFELLLGIAAFKSYGSTVLCASAVMKSIVGVAGGATRAAITQHQAIRGNMADVSAKDGSQETCVNLLASFFGLYILTMIENNTRCIWLVFFSVTVMHIYANFKAVKCLKMKTMNTSRFLLLLRHFLRTNTVNAVRTINDQESVILGCGITDYKLCGKKIYLGGSLQPIIRRKNITSEQLKKIKNCYRSFQYIVVDVDTSIHVVLKDNIKDEYILMAYFHAVIYGLVLSCLEGRIKNYAYEEEFEALVRACRETKIIEIYVNDYVSRKWTKYATDAILNGWITDRHQLFVDEWRTKWN
ncbi:RUS family member 1 [Planococcus citri]|uniref:RUS family member 1 n=1 Tax=Planococcus citri TaxID=170843 RepID=UPI0031F829C0